MYFKLYFLASFLLIGFNFVENVRCAIDQVEPDSLPIRVRRQIPQIPGIPGGIPDPSSIPGVNSFKNAIITFFQIIQGSGIAKNIPGADNIPGLPRSTRSAPATGAPDTDSIMMARIKREAHGTGNLPTKSG
ncbi:uncharacterized protein LOC116348416 isoform X1 [Contarinia nasturtii]|uniref:uncharacterized protein LOC116348416 isoform X1 n=1 Tax=Contarinia nasturtii TaxID=265458 RepID=UPI0012D49327|nr:uncharacterized protein LOC116348416 isoform X1 [Contarinia nasturtii]